MDWYSWMLILIVRVSIFSCSFSVKMYYCTVLSTIFVWICALQVFIIIIIYCACHVEGTVRHSLWSVLIVSHSMVCTVHESFYEHCNESFYEGCTAHSILYAVYCTRVILCEGHCVQIILCEVFTCVFVQECAACILWAVFIFCVNVYQAQCVHSIQSFFVQCLFVSCCVGCTVCMVFYILCTMWKPRRSPQPAVPPPSPLKSHTKNQTK